MESMQRSATRGVKTYFIIVLCCVFVFLMVTVEFPHKKVTSHMITFGDSKTKNSDCIPATEQNKAVSKKQKAVSKKQKAVSNKQNKAVSNKQNKAVSKKGDQKGLKEKEQSASKKESQKKYLTNLVRRLKAQHKPIVYAVVNDAFIPLADSWLCNTMFMGVHEQLLLVTPDDETKNYLLNKWPKINVISQPTEGLGGNQSYGRAGYWKMNIKRMTWTLMLLKLGVDVFMVEMDSIWFVNPIPHLKNLSRGVDIVTLNSKFQLKFACAGFVYVKPTKKSINMWKKLIEILQATWKKLEGPQHRKVFNRVTDQAVLTRLVIEEKYGGIKYQPASYKRYPDGMWYSKRSPKNPDVIQFNHIVGNQNKIIRAKKFGHRFVSNKDYRCDIEYVKNLTSRNSV